MRRVVAFDYLRVLAIACVCYWHWAYSLGWLGRVCGGVGNCLFFLLSGFCLGIQWREQGCPQLGVGFLAKRAIRIYPAFLIVVFGCFIAIVIRGGSVSVGELILNVSMLSWFGKIQGGGHLWFVTGLVIFYMLVPVLSRIKTTAILVIVTFFLVLQLVLCLVGVRQAYFLTMLIGAALAFVGGDYFLLIVGRLWHKRLIALSLIASSLILYGMLYGFGGDPKISVSYYWCCMLMSIFITGSVVLVSQRNTLQPLIVFIGGISYEIYLIHYPFLCGWLVDLTWLSKHEVIYACSYIGVTIVGAKILQMVAKLACVGMKKIFAEDA